MPFHERLKDIVYPLTTFAVLLAVWQFSVIVFEIPTYILPDLRDVGGALWRGYVGGDYWKHFFFTLTSMLSGYTVGCGLAIILGAIVAESRTVERFVFPFVIGLQSVPKVAIAPLVIVWFGFGIESKIVLVALICFFPVFVNTIVGMRSVDPALIQMMRAFNGSPLRVLLEVRLPNAVGPIFAGLQVSIVLGLIGALVGEFIASTRGLGYLIQNAASNLDLGTLFAAVLTLAVMGISGTQILRYLHKSLAFWDRGRNAVTAEH
ncbi:MAG TPA: ABC transporter permease [Pseudolabrys sp.]|nr:ABC transporter permease [Pseudolabrys sp.]